MSFLRKHSPFLAAAAMLCVLVCLMFPYCRYYVDPDATAYLTIARRYATFDFPAAFNGYWSPLSCWLTAVGIAAGTEAIKAAVVVNTVGALGFLLVSYSLFRRFKLLPPAVWLFCGALVLFLSYAVYYQLFADLWECFLLLAGLRILLAENFLRAPLLWVLYGAAGALAYFAKAYAFPFFLLNTAVSVFFLTQKNRRQWLKICVTSIVVMLVCAAPWLWALHFKYGHWMTSTVGTLNMSWYLEGHAHYKTQYGCLLPPPYTDAVYHWEDPYLVTGETPHFWDSPHYFLLQCARAVQNLLKMAGSMSALSLFFFPLWIATLIAFCSKRRRKQLPRDLQLLILPFLLFPLPFLLINFEPRYIWFLIPLGMILGHFALQQMKRRQKLALAVFAASFAIWPLLDINAVWNAGREEYELAQQLKVRGVRGSFTANTENNNDIQRMVRLAYFSGNSCYVAPVAGCSWRGLLREIRKYQIPYYFVAGRPVSIAGIIDENGKPFPMVYSTDNLCIFYIKPVLLAPVRLPAVVN